MKKNEAAIQRALGWAELMEQKYSRKIKESVSGTVEYLKLIRVPEIVDKAETEILLSDEDTVSAIMNHHEGKTAALNFASYKRPGGGFVDGMMAQEEALCHESYLYNVLRRFSGYYINNTEKMNSGFYTNRALYSPNILFRNETMCDIITCAAPNASRMIRYKTGQEKENQRALLERIFFVLNIAADQKVDTLILGAYGCGVFKQDPYVVSHAFKYYLEHIRSGTFKKVVFAIPNKESANYIAFKEVFGDWAKEV